MPTTTLIDIHHLLVEFGGKAVVHGIDFQIQAGETLALVGESGSGKSVTASAIMGLLPSGGTMTQGEVMHRSSGIAWARAGQQSQAPLGRGLSAVFQDPMSSLNPSMQVGWQIAEPLRVHAGASKAEAQRAATQLIQEVELPDPESTFTKYPHELSGGQKQRIMIALALAAQPELLIADEPTTALDSTVQKSILALLRKLQQQRQLSVLFITHDLDVVQEIADRVIVMCQGQIVESGPAETVLRTPQHPYTRALIDARKPALYSTDSSHGRALVSCEGLTKRYTTRTDLWGRPQASFDAVKAVNLTLYQGERVGLIGESGSGKSTLGRLLIGMLAPSEGAIQFDGKPLDAHNRKSMAWVRQRAQLVFQDPYSALNPKLTIGSALCEVLMHKGLSKTDAQQRCPDLLKEVGLSARDATKRPDEFSGGQRQRLVIARALAVEPEFLVLDESVAALDVQIQRDILELLAQIGEQRGLTYLFISHDLAVVASFCKRLLIMQNGRIVETGETHEILQNPKTSYTAELLASRPGNPSPLLL